jgi:hypothetical protein
MAMTISIIAIAPALPNPSWISLPMENSVPIAKRSSMLPSSPKKRERIALLNKTVCSYQGAYQKENYQWRNPEPQRYYFSEHKGEKYYRQG